MARIFITGSADGLGRATAQTLLGDGHEVIVHARSAERLAAVKDLIGRGASAVVGDLADLDQTRAVAERVNELGGVDAVIHNAGVISGPPVMPVNIVAPYLLTAVINRPQRLIYLSSGMHHGGRADVAGLDWNSAPARDLAAMLPTTIDMRDLLGREKTGRLPRQLNIDGTTREFDYQVGELAYWSPGNDLVIFYADDGQAIPQPGLVRLGTIDTGLEVIAAAGNDFELTVEPLD
jgi:hypothetical protein